MTPGGATHPARSSAQPKRRRNPRRAALHPPRAPRPVEARRPLLFPGRGTPSVVPRQIHHRGKFSHSVASDPNFLPPLGGRCHRQRGGARSADGCAYRRPAPAPPLSLRDISPRKRGEKFPSAALPHLSGERPPVTISPPWGEKSPAPFFSPPWGGDADRQRGGAAPTGTHNRCPAPTRPPSVAPRHLPPQAGGEISERCASTFERGKVAGPKFLPQRRGENVVGYADSGG